MRRTSSEGNLVILLAAATVVGLLTGAVAGAFRMVLEIANSTRNHLITWGYGYAWLGLLMVMAATGTATFIAAWLVRHVEPKAVGSGIPNVEAIVAGRAEIPRLRLLPVKFLGGILAMGSGLSLGREGPSVHMGAAVAGPVANLFRRNRNDTRVLIASGGGAGLAAAFHAPLASGVFILEELFKKFDMRTTLATVGAAAAGIAVAQVITPGSHEFKMSDIADPRIEQWPFVVAVGIIAGALGIAFNKSVLWSLDRTERMKIHPLVRAFVIGASVGAIAWFYPDLVGGGEDLTQSVLFGNGTFVVVLLVLVFRFALSVVSYTAGTPGGLFAPMLVIGTQAGFLVGLVAQDLMPLGPPDPRGLALVGMAAFFTATVRAPITGLILTAEVTGNTNMLPPSLGACAIAMLLTTLSRTEPLYDALAARTQKTSATDAVKTMDS